MLDPPQPPAATASAEVAIVSAFVCLPTHPPTGWLEFVYLFGVVSPNRRGGMSATIASGPW